MATYVASCLPMAMHSVMDSIQLDNDGKVKEAYCSYLSSMLFIIKTLKDDAWDQEFSKICNQDTIKLLKLVAQCHERAVDIVSSFKQEGPSPTDVPNQRPSISHSLPPPQTGNVNTQDARDRCRSLDTGSQSLPAASDVSKTTKTPSSSGANNIDKLILSLPTPPSRKGSFNSAAPRSTNISNIDGLRRKQMCQAYQRRKSLQSNIQQKLKADYNLYVIRRTMENMTIEKSQREALNKKLEERRERLRIKAEQRFADKTGSRTTDAAYEKKIYAKILEFEQETTWPQTLRENLAAQPEDVKLIEDIVKRVLGSKEHPLGQLIAEMQFALYRELSLLVSDFACPVYEQPPFKKRRSMNSVDFGDVKYDEIGSSRFKSSNDEDLKTAVDISAVDDESKRLIEEGFGVKMRASGAAEISKKDLDSHEAEEANAEESDKHVEMAEIAALRGEMSSPEANEKMDPETEVSKADKTEVEMADVAGLKVADSIRKRPSSVEDTASETVDEPKDALDNIVSDVPIDTGDDVSKAEVNEKSVDSKVDIKNKSKGSMKISSKNFDSEFNDFEEYMLENLDSDDFNLLPDESCVQTDTENMRSEEVREKDDFETSISNSKDEQKPVNTQELDDITVLSENGVEDGTRNKVPSSDCSREDTSLKVQPSEGVFDSETDALKDISSDPRLLTRTVDGKVDDEDAGDGVEPSFQEDTAKDGGGMNVSDRDNGANAEYGPFIEQNVNETQNVGEAVDSFDKSVECSDESGKTEDFKGIRDEEECEIEAVNEQHENEADTESSFSSKLAQEDSVEHVNRTDSEQVVSLDQELQNAQIGESAKCKSLGEGNESKESQDDELSADTSEVVERGSTPSVEKLKVVQKNEVIEDLINELIDRNKKYQTDVSLDLDEEISDDIFDDEIPSESGCPECVRENEGSGLDGQLAGENESDSKNSVRSSEQSIDPESGRTHTIESKGLTTDSESSSDRLKNERTTVLEQPGRVPLHSDGDNDVFNDDLMEQYSKCGHNSEDYGKLKKKVDNAVKEVHASLDKLHSLLIVTYDELDLPIGRDQSYAAVEAIFFKPLWQWLNLVFRRLHLKKEFQMYEVIKKRWECGPLDFFVREKYALQEAEDESTVYPYEVAVEELKKIVSYSSPLDKLECLVLTSKLICQCVTDYWIKRGDPSPPTVGCDDLLPILTYVTVKAALPQLVSECHAIEEFINESYLLGEEGYCLTTLSTAIAYVLNLRSGVMPGQSLT